MAKLLVEEVLVSLFKDILIPLAIGAGLASAISVGIHLLKKREVVPLPLQEPIVCMQDAPIYYDWNQELITNLWHDGVGK